MVAERKDQANLNQQELSDNSLFLGTPMPFRILFRIPLMGGIDKIELSSSPVGDDG
jgi:hypothetical protein